LARARAGAPDIDAQALRRSLDEGLAGMALDLDEQARERLIAYIGLLHHWNRSYNLTAVRDARDMIYRHVLDSLTAMAYLRGEQCLDVGSGAGLPGLVLAVARPDQSWVLLDSNGKKCRFLSHAQVELGLGNVRVERSRVEDFHPEARFSTIISRALSDLAKFVAGAGHLLAPGGCFLAMKGRNPERELSTLGELGKRAEVVPVCLPGLEEGQRHLVIISPAGADGPSRKQGPRGVGHGKRRFGVE
jgi:16S rRNA (guanine527-N7)-methyltransferase